MKLRESFIKSIAENGIQIAMEFVYATFVLGISYQYFGIYILVTMGTAVVSAIIYELLKKPVLAAYHSFVRLIRHVKNPELKPIPGQ